MDEHRQFLKLVLVRDEARPCRDSNEHAAQVQVVSKANELRPLVHLGIMRAHVAVLLLHITSYIRQRVGMGMILQMAVKLFADAADVFQPLIEAYLILCLLRDSNYHTPDGAWRHDAADCHHFAVASAHYIINERAQGRLRAFGGLVAHAQDDLTAVVFVHRMQDAACDVGAHAVDSCHRHIGSSRYHLSLLEQLASQSLPFKGRFGRVFVGDVKSHQAVGDEGVADEDGKLRHQIDIVLLAVGDEALAVVRTLVVLEGRVAQSYLLGSATGGKAADDATEEDEHDGAAQHLVAHKMDAWCRTDSDDGEGPCCMGIGQSEHEPHAVPPLTHRPRHNGRRQQLGQRADHDHDGHQPKRLGMTDEDIEVDNHAHTDEEVWNEQGIAYELEA